MLYELRIALTVIVLAFAWAPTLCWWILFNMAISALQHYIRFILVLFNFIYFVLQLLIVGTILALSS